METKISSEITLPKPYLKLIWPTDRERVMSLLEPIANVEMAKRVHRFRSATSEIALGSISFDLAGKPILTQHPLPSTAFREGGWQQIQDIMEDMDWSPSHLIAAIEAGGTTSPLIWTSANPHVARTFGPDVRTGMDMVFMVITPDPKRQIFPRRTSPEQEQQLRIAVQKKKPLTIEIPPVSGKSVRGKTWGETLMGPYIGEKEIKLLLRIPRRDEASFDETINQLFPQEKPLH